MQASNEGSNNPLNDAVEQQDPGVQTMPVSVLKKPSNRNLRNSRSNLTGSYDNFNKSKTVSRSRYDGTSSKEKQRLK